MSTTASRLLEAVAAALRDCPATGGNAERGLPATDLPAPYGRVRLGTLASTNGPELTSHEQRILIDLYIVPQPTGDSLAEREDSALEAMDQAVRAIHASPEVRAIATNQPDVNFAAVEDAGLSGLFYVVGTVEVSYYLDNLDGGI